MSPHCALPAVDSAIDQALADKRIVGAVVLVARDGKIICRRAAGLADRERGIAMRDANRTCPSGLRPRTVQVCQPSPMASANVDGRVVCLDRSSVSRDPHPVQR